MLDEIRMNDNRYTYQFHLALALDRPGGRDRQPYFAGRVVEKGDDWVRVRQRILGGGGHEDVLIPLHAILWVEERFDRE